MRRWRHSPSRRAILRAAALRHCILELAGFGFRLVSIASLPFNTQKIVKQVVVEANRGAESEVATLEMRGTSALQLPSIFHT